MVAVPDHDARRRGHGRDRAAHDRAARVRREHAEPARARRAARRRRDRERAALRRGAPARRRADRALGAEPSDLRGQRSRRALHASPAPACAACSGATRSRLYETDGDGQPARCSLAVRSPPSNRGTARASTAVLLELLRGAAVRREPDADACTRRSDWTRVPRTCSPSRSWRATSTSACWSRSARSRLPDQAGELLRAVANQVAVALAKAELIERLTEENMAHDLFASLERGSIEDAQARARRARCDLDRAHVFIQVDERA